MWVCGYLVIMYVGMYGYKAQCWKRSKNTKPQHYYQQFHPDNTSNLSNLNNSEICNQHDHGDDFV